MLNALIAAFSLVSGPPAVSARTIETTLQYISSDAVAGRMTLSPGMDLAANHLASQFRKFGLSEGIYPGYFHSFPITVSQKPTSKNMLTITLAGGKRFAMEIGKDYVPLLGSDAMKLVNAPLVYVGYGLAEDKWNDYAGVDVTGKIVLALRGVPEGMAPLATGAKARTAAEKGAVGIFVIGPSGPGRSELPPYTRNYGIYSGTDLVGAGIHSKYFQELVGMPFEAARAAKAPASKPINALARIVTETEPNKGTTRNIIGFVPGKDPDLRHEYIVLGAHFDHLGWGEIGSRTGVDAIHYGADDNGSGTAMVVALAEYFAKARTNRRTLIFQLYSAEELGLVGSRQWLDDPTSADYVKGISGMINMDMVGRLRFGTVFVFGQSSSLSWDGVLKQVNVKGLKLDVKPHMRGDSDQASFARHNIPALFFHTGLTNEYHTEKDTYDTVNIPGMMLIADAIRQVVEGIDKLDSKMEFNPKTEFGNRPEDRRIPGGGIGR